MKESTRVGLCQLIPSSCFINSYEDLCELSVGDEVALWLRDIQDDKYFVVGEVVFNGLPNEVYNEDYFASVGIKPCWIRHMSVNDFIEGYPLILKYKRVDGSIVKDEYCFADCLDILKLNDNTKKYSTGYVEYWNGAQFSVV